MNYYIYKEENNYYRLIYMSSNFNDILLFNENNNNFCGKIIYDKDLKIYICDYPYIIVMK